MFDSIEDVATMRLIDGVLRAEARRLVVPLKAGWNMTFSGSLVSNGSGEATWITWVTPFKASS